MSPKFLMTSAMKLEVLASPPMSLVRTYNIIITQGIGKYDSLQPWCSAKCEKVHPGSVDGDGVICRCDIKI